MPLNTPLTDIQELVERSIFHSIRKQCVAKGYTPDIIDYPKTEQGYQDYVAAFKAINEIKGFSIEVFNSGSPQDRLLKKLPRIVTSTQGFLPGSIGGDQSHKYKLENGVYYATIAPPTTSDLYTNIHIVSQTIEQHRILSSIMALSVPRIGYIQAWLKNESDEPFNIFVKHLSYVPLRQSNTPGTIETIYRYVCPDLFEVEDIVVQEGISPLNQISIIIEDDDGNIDETNIIQ